MTSPTTFEFLLVSTDYQTLTAVAGALKQIDANLGFVPTVEAARDYVGRRKIDGIFVDMEIPGAVDLINFIRQSSCNRHAMVFGCRGTGIESPETLEARVNFLLQKPLSEEVVLSHVTSAREVMARERRRYFRHPVSLPVSLSGNGMEQRARMTNLSEGGMAVHTVKPVEFHSVIDFAFELAIGAAVSGKGLITWVNSEGMIGVAFQFLRGKGRDHLLTWITERQRISPMPLIADG
jgi:response regulator RpfG family c-di-GMP phosphodiesterase